MSIEKKVVGALISFPDRYADVSDVLSEGCFAEPGTRAIFEVFVRLYAEDADVSKSLIQERIFKGGGDYDVTEIIDYLDSGSSLVEHCQILKEKEVKREQLVLASELMSRAGDVKEDAFDTNDFLMEQAERVVSMVDFGGKVTNMQLIKAVTKKMELAQSAEGLTGISTGFRELDKVYGGRQRSDLIIKAARPAMGKTAQALCEAKHMAFEEGKRVIFFSLEMSAEQLMQRLVSVHTGIPLGDIRGGKLKAAQWDNYNTNADYLTNDNLIIVDNVYSLNGIRTRCKKLKMKGGIDAIYIDYLQLITHKVGAGRSKEQEVSEISRALKMLAKSLDVPVVCLSQLSRAVETRGGTHKPMLSDLRDSGAIEQDADIVEFIFRPEYYEKEDDTLHGIAYVIIAKHRNGACGDIELRFKHECTRFENANDYPTIVPVAPSSMKPSTDFDLDNDKDPF